MAGREALAVSLVERLIFDRDVWRIPHHHMVLLPKNPIQLRQILRTIHMLAAANASEIHCPAFEVQFTKSPPM